MSDAVELRLLKILNHPTESPYGNPIPGLEELLADGQASGIEEFRIGVEPLDKVVDQATGESVRVLVRRIAEPVQTDDGAMAVLRKARACWSAAGKPVA
jgi:DtxR family Mn-dependent transcriptional regulator